MHTLLLEKMPHAEVAQTVNCSIGQVKKMSANLNKYGSVVPPPVYKRGRPPVVDYEMRVVCEILIYYFGFSVTHFE